MTGNIVIPKDLAEMSVWGMAQMKRVVPYSAQHLTKLAKEGKFPAPFAIGGKSLWHAAAVIEFLNAAIAKADMKSAA